MSPSLSSERRDAGRLILASASPRRHELLGATGLAFEVEPSDAEEEHELSWTPEEIAQRLAERKSAVVAARHRGERAWVVAADTVVALDALDGGGAPLLLGKPADSAEARRMLGLLSGSRHRVVTGVAVRACDGDRRSCAGFERTWVSMRRIAPSEIEAYVVSGEWRDKAGGYAIQESADAFVTALEEGGFDNVVGLPVGLTLRLLAECGVPLPRR